MQPAHQTVYYWVKEPAEMKLVLCAARSSPVRATVPTLVQAIVLFQVLILVSG